MITGKNADAELGDEQHHSVKKHWHGYFISTIMLLRLHQQRGLIAVSD